MVECKPEDFLKNVCKIQKPISKIKSNSNSLVNQKSFYHSIIRNSNVHKSIHRKYESKLTKKPIKSLISIENSGKNDETQLKFFAENNLIKRNFIKNFKKKTKKGFLSHRKNHRNQKRREVNFIYIFFYRVINLNFF